MFFNFHFNRKQQRSKPKIEKPVKLTIFLFPAGGVEIYPAFMDDQEEEAARALVEWIQAFPCQNKKGGGR